MIFTSETRQPLMPGVNRKLKLTAVEIKETSQKTPMLQLTFSGEAGQRITQSYYEPRMNPKNDQLWYERDIEKLCGQITSIFRAFPTLANAKINPDKNPSYTWFLFISDVAKLLETVIPLNQLMQAVLVFGPRNSSGKAYLTFPSGLNYGIKKYFTTEDDAEALIIHPDYVLIDPSIKETEVATETASATF